MKPWAFEAILQYLYTDRLHIEMDKIDDCIRLARQCKLEYLKSQLEIRLRSIQLFGKELWKVNWSSQHDTSVEQRKNLSPLHESNPRPPEHRAG